MQLHLTDQPTAEETAYVFETLRAFNDGLFGPGDRQSLAILIKDGGTMHGGLIGNTGWGWLFIQWLVVAESRRGEGLGTRLIAAAEDEARRRGCHSAWIDTINPQSLRLYRRLGYQSFGEISRYVAGFPRVYLKKEL